MAKLQVGINDLATVYPELVKQWHPTKNGNLNPTDVKAGSNKKVWWCLPYDVPMDYPVEHLRGKHFDFEWKDEIVHRTVENRNCPYFSGRAVWKGFNDLATTHPELVTQWHPDNDFKPTDITSGSSKIVKWLYPYDVPMDYPIEHLRGKHLDFEWTTSVAARSRGGGCPYLSGQAVWQGFNDLSTTHQGLAAEWHPTKNGKLTPTDVNGGSNKKVWWYLPYDVPMDYPIEQLRGKHFNFEWETAVGNRKRGNDCPYLTGNAVWHGFNDLATTHPILASQWHPTKNGELKPTDVMAGSRKKVWWLYIYNNQVTGKQQKFEWESTVANRNKDGSCPFIFSSKGEEAIREILIVNKVDFEEQYKFKDRFYKSPKHTLKDDFAIFDKNGKVVATIEFHGEQHYKPVDFAGKGKEWAEEEFKKNQLRDKIKTEYLAKHRIRQLIVPYTEFDNVEVIVKSFIEELSKDYDLFNSKESKNVAEWIPPSRQSEVSKKDVKDFMKMINNYSKIKPIKKTELKTDLLERKNMDISF